MHKIKYLILPLLLLLSLGLSAQNFNGGFLAGGAVSQVNGDPYRGFDQLGWTAGAFLNLPLGNDFYFHTELKYALFGSHSDVKEEDAGLHHYNLRLHYAEIPFMFCYNFSRLRIHGKPLDFITLELGGSFDFLLFHKDATNFTANETAPWRFFSVTANAGLHFDLTKNWGIGVRSMNSITPIRYTDSPGFHYGHYYNIVLQAVVTYTFNAARDAK